MSSTSIEERFRSAQVAIGNALADPALLAALTEYGYNANRLQQGNALREQAWALYQQQKGQYGELSAAGDDLEAARQQARATYMHYVRIARLAFSNNRGASQKLDLSAERKRPLAKWLARTQQFYTQALSDTAIRDKLAEYGVTQAMLEAGRRQLDAVGNSEATRQQRRGAARGATRARDEMLAALDAWMRNFTKVARMAFEGRPQLLEKLGIKARATQAARTPAAAAPSEVAFAADAPTLELESQPPAPERRNGRATATHR